MPLSQLVSILAIVVLSFLIGGSAYESVVVAPNWASQPLQSLASYRGFLHVVTPARYFRLFAPLGQIVLVVALLLAWTAVPARWYALASLAALLLADAITFAFHYPRNRVLFMDALSDPERLTRVARQWSGGNAVRVCLTVTALLAQLQVLRLGR